METIFGKDNAVTLTFTTSRRLDLFIRTVNKLMFYCNDVGDVELVQIFDDCSGIKDVRHMLRLIKFWFPNIDPPRIFSSGTVRGHANRMQCWYEQLDGKYVFHCEDDWEFVASGTPISDGIKIMESNPNIGQVGFRYGPDTEPRHVTPCGVKFWITGESYHPVNWPHFTLSPSVIRVESVKSVGNFREVPGFEREFAERWTEAGLLTAHLDRPYVQHIGEGRSAYDLNQTQR